MVHNAVLRDAAVDEVIRNEDCIIYPGPILRRVCFWSQQLYMESDLKRMFMPCESLLVSVISHSVIWPQLFLSTLCVWETLFGSVFSWNWLRARKTLRGPKRNVATAALHTKPMQLIASWRMMKTKRIWPHDLILVGLVLLDQLHEPLNVEFRGEWSSGIKYKHWSNRLEL